MLKAIVFDFDGVLANSEPLHYRAMRVVLETEGVTLSERAYYEKYLGYDDAGAFRAIADDWGITLSDAQLASLIERKGERMEELERVHSALFPGTAELIRRAAAEVPVAIASGAFRTEIVRTLDAVGLTGLFAAIVGAEDTPRSKPAPDPYLRAVELLRPSVAGLLEAGHCVAVEDSVWGLQSARAAGLKTVAVTQTYPAEALAGAADLVIDKTTSLDFTVLRQFWAS